MTHDPASVLTLITEQIAALQSERAELVERLAEIDKGLAKAAAALGVDLKAAEPASAEKAERLPRPMPSGPATIGGAMLDVLRAADRGLTRAEVRDAIYALPQFKAKIDHNPNAFYNTTGRYLKKGWLVEIERLLYHADRAPLPEGQEDDTGTHLPGNVSSLFGAERRAVNVED